jgi:hypothetical protein
MNEIRMGGVVYAQQDETGNMLVVSCENMGFWILIPLLIVLIVSQYQKGFGTSQNEE